MGNETLKFKVDKINLLKELSDEQLAIAEVWVCCEGDNAHELPITHEALVKAIPTLYNKFLVAGFDGYDFMGHEGSNQLILGFFPKESKIEIRTNEKGVNYIVANAIISKIYAEWAYDIFEETNYRDVSMEIYVLSTKHNEENDKTYITEFCFMGVTVLGLDYTPACSGANIRITKFSDENVENFIEESTNIYRHRIDFSDTTWTIPQIVKDNAQLGLELQEEYGFTFNSISVATAKYLANHDTIDVQKARHYKRYFPSTNKLQKMKEESNGEITRYYINYMLWGGIEGCEWLGQVFSDLEKIDNEIHGYFNSKETTINNNERKGDLVSQGDIENSAMNENEKTIEMSENLETEVKEFEADNKEEEVVEETKEEFAVEEKTEDSEEKDVVEMAIETEKEVVDNDYPEVEVVEEEELVKEEMAETVECTEVECAEAEKVECAETETVECAETEKVECAEEVECAEKVECAEEKNDEEKGEITVEMQYAQLKTEFEALQKECESLREFKMSVEDEKKNCVVMSTIMEVQDRCEGIPMEELDSWKADAKNFSYDDIENWKQKVYSKAFMFSTKTVKKDNEITKMGLSFNNDNNAETKHEKRFVWDD